MLLQILKSKIHRATLTDCLLEYEGSLSVDLDLLERAGILPGERILVVNQTNGERLETYAIAAPRGSRMLRLNGAAARRGQPGDMITVMAFAAMPPDEARDFDPTVVVLDPVNRSPRDT